MGRKERAPQAAAEFKTMQIEMFGEREMMPASDAHNGASRPVGSRRRIGLGRIRQVSTMAMLSELRRLMQDELASLRLQIRRLGEQAAVERERQVATSETVDLINVKLSQLKYDLFKEPPPKPTRRQPMG